MFRDFYIKVFMFQSTLKNVYFSCNFVQYKGTKMFNK